VNESSWALVLQEAEKARGLVADKKTRNEGLRLFDQLASEHPDDGMVYFKRAEAREALRETESASADYKKAQGLFSKELWQNLTRGRAEHLDEQINSRKLRQKVHHALGPRALELSSVEESAWRAGTFIKSSPFISLELSRTALVRVIIALEGDDRSKSSGPTPWAQRIDRLNNGLPAKKRLSVDSIKSAKWILFKRDCAVYRSESVSEAEAEQAFDRVLDFARQAV
jgi:tetratricopeptide (TPR) repeat protein